MQLDRALGLPEFGPVKNLGAQIDHRCIQAHQLVLKPEFLFLALRQRLAFVEQTMEHGLVQLPGAMLVGVGQGGAGRRLRHPQVPQFALAGGESTADFPQ